MPEKYIRKVSPVEAQQFTGGELQANELDAWLDLWGDVSYNAERFVESEMKQFVGSQVLIPVLQFPEYLTIITDQGNFHVPLGSWIVKSSDGTLYVHDDAMFKTLYERVDENG